MCQRGQQELGEESIDTPRRRSHRLPARGMKHQKGIVEDMSRIGNVAAGLVAPLAYHPGRSQRKGQQLVLKTFRRRKLMGSASWDHECSAVTRGREAYKFNPRTEPILSAKDAGQRIKKKKRLGSQGLSCPDLALAVEQDRQRARSRSPPCMRHWIPTMFIPVFTAKYI
jgi:hypothetical protein